MQPQDYLISKTFIFQNQLTLSCQPIDILLHQNIQQINIQQIISIFTHKNAILLPLSFSIYNPQINLYISIDPTKPLQKFYVFSPVIMIRYKIQPVSDKDIDVKVQNSKIQRNKERSIREVLQYVKQWREIHLEGGGEGKVSLQDAAKIVGISKKSLDDYFCQLRLAEEYGFDFGENMEEKIGVMRSYVKERRGKGEGQSKTVGRERLPKRLRVLEDIEDEGKNKVKKRLIEKVQSKQQKPEQQVKVQVLETIIQQQPLPIPMPSYLHQNKFYSSFDLRLDEFEDPFVRFKKEGDSQGKGEFEMEEEGRYYFELGR